MAEEKEQKKKKKIDYSSAWAEARKIVWGARWRLLFGSILMLVSRLAGMVLPSSMKYIGDEVFTNHNYSLLKWIALAIGVSTLIQGVTGFTLSQILGVAAQRAITDMRKNVQKHIERLPISYFDSVQSGQLISRIMNDAEGIRNLVGTGLGQILGSIVTATISIGVLFYINWQLTSATLVVLLVFGGTLLYAFKVLRPVFRNRSVINAEVTGRLGESLGGIRIVKAYTAEKREELSFARGAHRLFRNVAKTVTGVSAISSFSSVIIGAIAVVMIIIGGNAVQANSMTLGDFLMYISFTFLLAMPVIELTSIGTQITEALAGLDRIREIMSMTTEDEEDARKEPLPEVKGTIDFEDVFFEYDAGVPVLKGISFHAEAGATTALVGSSGSGKSTILSLVLNFIQPTRNADTPVRTSTEEALLQSNEGSEAAAKRSLADKSVRVPGLIKIDGKDLRSVRLRDYRRHLGVVLQDNFLFDGTILENIRFSNPEANLDEIKEMCRIANADEFIEKFPNGYDTVVGERGVKLSGGQRQRIAIARALLADPRILILDEATSSLDSESEALIQEGLNRLRKGRTTFVIAHRLSTIRSADQILVVEGGEILERGTHEELIALDGRYKQLYDKQYRFEQNLFVNPGEDFTGKPEVLAADETLAINELLERNTKLEDFRSMPSDQTYSNHVRWYPLFHFVVMPLLLLNLIEHLVRVFMNTGDARWDQVGWSILSLTLILLALAARLMILKVQDRVIRLEERLRYREILAAELASRADSLPLGQVIALRFASDAELSTLVERALNGEFAKNKDIKTSIKEWRGDYVRA